jgi:eukaryotic-like serine/threonine-protein kinase
MTERDPLSLAGHVIADKYEVERLVGEGGFAVVYRAIHTIWKKPVAIKFFSGLSSAPVELRDSLQSAFIQEGALLTELSSQTAGIVQARDVGACTTPSGQWVPYMVLEWLEGRSLEDVLIQDRKLGLPWNVHEVVAFLVRVLPSLEVAHARGVAHRDIKPANLFVMGSAARSERTPIKLLDFGVAKMVSDHEHFKAALAKTGVGISSFTPQYGAPEQFTRSYGATGPWTDVYAMALVAVEMLLGRDALEGDDLVQLGFATANPSARPTPRRLGAKVPDSVEAVFQRALAVQPQDRYPSAGALLEAVLAAVDGTEYAFRGPISSQPILHAPSGDFTAMANTVVAPPGRPEVSSRNPTVVAAVKSTAPPKRGGWLTTLLALLIGAASLTAVFAASDLDGAERTREVLLGAYYSVQGASGVPSVEPAPSVVGSSNTVELAPVVPVAGSGGCPTGMVYVPGGTLLRDAATETSGQKQTVALDGYCLDVAEVTAADYATCVTSGGCPRPTNKVSWPKIKNRHYKVYPALCTYGREDEGGHPINCVDWFMAEAYCKSVGKRLPTEAEWEHAATGTDHTGFPWGNDDPTSQHVNACDERCKAFAKKESVPLRALLATDDGHAATAPVRSYEQGRSRLGVYDLAGNVREWVSDFHAEYEPGVATNPTGPASGKLKVLRGGGWDSGFDAELGAGARDAENPHALHPSIGFRCAKPQG